MCNIEKQLETKNKMPEVYKLCIDDTLSVMKDVETTLEFLTTLKNSHQSIDFLTELEENGRLPFLGMEVMKNGCSLKNNRRTEGHCYTTTWMGHINAMNTMHTTVRFSSHLHGSFLHKECERLKETIARLCYPDNLVESTIRQFMESKVSRESRRKYLRSDKREAPIRKVLPFKDQKSANAVRKQLGNLSRKVNEGISPV